MDELDREERRQLHEELTRDRGPYSANGALRSLRALYNDGGRTYDLPPNPITRAVRFNKERRRDSAVALDEMPKLWAQLDAIECPIMRNVWLTLLLTGLRKGDARRMRWEHLEDGILLVPSPKGGRSFKLPLCNHLLESIEPLRGFGSEYILPSPKNLSKPPVGLKRSKVFDYSPHAMRHNCATHALEAGIDHTPLKVLLNHACGDVTFGYVTRAHLTGHLKDATERVAARLLSYK